MQEEVIQHIVENKREIADLKPSQRFLFYTLESLVYDVWRQLNTDSLLFLDNDLANENARIAKVIAEAVLSVLEYSQAPTSDKGQKALERLTITVNTILDVLVDVNGRSLAKWQNRTVPKAVTSIPSIPVHGNFDLSEVRLAERALLTAVNPSAHILSTAGRSSYFFDFDRFEMNINNAHAVRRALVSKINAIRQRFGVDYLGILEKRGENTVGCLMISDYLSSETGVPMILIRLARQLVVDRVKTAKGAVLNGKRILPITDNVSNGTEIRSVIHCLEQYGHSH